VSSRFLILLVVFLTLSPPVASARQVRSNSVPAYRHAYYLFLADPPNGCEACYVPLLVTSAPLEEAAKDRVGQDCGLITTYERDSIFQFNGIVHVAPRDVEAAPRTIRIRKRNYRFQEITAAEILRLLENPLGTIPISRPFLKSELPQGPSLEKLIADFRAVK
jgi:hypothetical protein